MEFLSFIDWSGWQGLLFFVVAFALLNRLRGMIGILSLLPTALLGFFVWMLTNNFMAAGLVAGAYFVGESWGWTKWINCIKLDLTQAKYNEKWAYPKEVDKPDFESIMQLLMDDQKDYKPYVILGMVIRGALWWAPVFVLGFLWSVFSLPWAIIGTIGLAVLFPVCYHIGYKILPAFGYLKKAEVIYGAVYGAVLWGALYSPFMV